MKAAILRSRQKQITFEIQDVPTPSPREREVLVRVRASSINAADYRSIQLGVQPKSGYFGADFSGVVVATGDMVNEFKPGDEVFGDLSASGFGSFAEYVIAPPHSMAINPSCLDFQETAALPLAALTALNAIRVSGGVREGQKVLVYGAGGGVGGYLVQLLKASGAAVTAVCGPGSVDTLTALKADSVIDYTLNQTILTPGSYDLIFMVNGSKSRIVLMKALTPGGTCTVIGGGYPLVFKTLFFGPLMSLGAKKIKLLSFKPTREDLEQISELADKGVLLPVIDKIFPFSELNQAFTYVKNGHVRGKVVISIA